MPPKVNLLEARNLGRRRPDGTGWLLDDVSLEVGPGERIALAGPSGAGKTILLRCMALLDPLDVGEVRWQGWPIRRDAVPLFRKAVIYVHQRPALFDETVEAALRRPFSLKVHRRKQFDRSRVLGLLASLGRGEDFLDKRVADLSGGEIQIAALVRAVQLDPSVLLLDEPTAALDRGTTAAAEAMLLAWLDQARADRALIWISHDAEQARRVGQKVVMMEGGRIV